MDPVIPEGAPAPEPTATESNPWEPWGQVFEDPSQVNPYEVHQHHKWVQDLRSDDMHGPTLERALRDWGYLQEGEGLADFQQALEQRRQATADPFAAMRGGEEELAEEEPLSLDPHALRQVWDSDMQRMREEMMAEFENRQASARLELELERQLDKVVGEKGLDADDRQDLWNKVQYRIQTGQVQPHQLQSLVGDTFAAEEARLNKWMNARLSSGTASTEPTAPPPGAGGGAAPTASAPPTTLKSLARRSMERLGQMDD